MISLKLHKITDIGISKSKIIFTPIISNLIQKTGYTIMAGVIFLEINMTGFTPTLFNLGSITGLLVTIMLITALVCFIVSELTQNYSQVDKLWSLMPIAYSIIVLTANPTPRLWLMTILVTIWGLRLSLNFGRKGGYSIIPWQGEEDYRWKIMRAHPDLRGRIKFGMFNFFFISLYQHFLILLFCTPLLLASGSQNNDLTLIDKIAAFMMLLFIAIETIADNQQYNFQELKKRGAITDGFYGKSLKNGFVCDGLWSHVRHPNFISEQLIWLSFYMFGVAATGRWFNWTIAGSVLLVLLFQGSTQLTETISSKKYPAYASYKKAVPKFFPKLFGNRK